MNKADINIGHIQIRLHGLPLQAATDLSSGLGSEIMGQLTGWKPPTGSINQVDAGKLAAESAAADELRRAVARQIARAVAQTGTEGD